MVKRAAMNFMQFLRSFDDLLYEIVTWLVFYPVTLWRTVRRPLAMMAYADTELSDTPEEQYTDTLSPPLFLLPTLLLSHGIELALVGQNPVVASNKGLASLISDDTSLLLMRLVFFSIFPLIMAVGLLRRQRVRLTRASLRQPFYAQCYPTALFALVLGLGALLLQLNRGPEVHAAGAALIAAALLWYGIVQTRWFARMLGVGVLRGFGIATLAMLECMVAIFVMAPLLA